MKAIRVNVQNRRAKARDRSRNRSVDPPETGRRRIRVFRRSASVADRISRSKFAAEHVQGISVPFDLVIPRRRLESYSPVKVFHAFLSGRITFHIGWLRNDASVARNVLRRLVTGAALGPDTGNQRRLRNNPCPVAIRAVRCFPKARTAERDPPPRGKKAETAAEGNCVSRPSRKKGALFFCSASPRYRSVLGFVTVARFFSLEFFRDCGKLLRAVLDFLPRTNNAGLPRSLFFSLDKLPLT